MTYVLVLVFFGYSANTSLIEQADKTACEEARKAFIAQSPTGAAAYCIPGTIN